MSGCSSARTWRSGNAVSTSPKGASFHAVVCFTMLRHIPSRKLQDQMLKEATGGRNGIAPRGGIAFRSASWELGQSTRLRPYLPRDRGFANVTRGHIEDTSMSGRGVSDGVSESGVGGLPAGPAARSRAVGAPRGDGARQAGDRNDHATRMSHKAGWQTAITHFLPTQLKLRGRCDMLPQGLEGIHAFVDTGFVSVCELPARRPGTVEVRGGLRNDDMAGVKEGYPRARQDPRAGLQRQHAAARTAEREWRPHAD